jgi:hypothetical protein
MLAEVKVQILSREKLALTEYYYQDQLSEVHYNIAI